MVHIGGKPERWPASLPWRLCLDHGPEVIGSSVALVPTNAPAVTDQFAGERPTSHYRSGSIADRIDSGLPTTRPKSSDPAKFWSPHGRLADFTTGYHSESRQQQW